MIDKIELDLKTPTFPKQSARFAGKKKGKKARCYQPKELTKKIEVLKMEVLNQMPKNFAIWENKPIFVEKLKYKFEYKKSTIKKIKKAGLEIPKYTKPDLHDNLNKALFDVLEGIVFDNDSRIWKFGELSKVWAPEPGIEIILKLEK